MKFEKVVRERHSVRDFSSKDIPNDILMKVVELAQRTPSWANSQPWKVYIAKGKSLERIKELHVQRIQENDPSETEMRQISRSYWNAFPLDNMAQWGSELGQFLGSDIQDMDRAQIELFHAPVLVYLTAKKEVSPWMVYDMGAFSQTLMLAAKDQGIDSISAYEIARFPEDIRKVMEIPDDEMIIGGIALGYPTEDRMNDFYTDRVETDQILKIKE